MRTEVMLQVLLGLSLPTPICHAGVELYLFPDYKGLIHEVQSGQLFSKNSTDPNRSACVKLNLTIATAPKSIRLLDIDCVMVYETTNCDGQSFRLASKGRDNIGRNVDNLTLRGIERTFVGSLRRCDKIEGGDIINVDLLGYEKPVKSFLDVCDCIAIPDIVSNLTKRIRNNGHCLIFFEGMQCSGEILQVPSGNIFQYPNYLGERVLGRLPLIKSFRPCDIPLHCRYQVARLRAVIHRYIIHPLITPDKFGIVDQVARTSFKNNGSVAFTRNYELKNTVKEIYTVRKNEVFGKVRTTSTEVGSQNELSASVETEIGGEFLKSFSAKVTAGLQTSIASSLVQAHAQSLSSSREFAKERTEEKSKEFTIADQIQVPPCTEYEVSSFVKILQNVPVNYTIYFSITGEKDGVLVPASILVDLIGTSATLIGSKTEHSSIQLMAMGMMTASIGLESAVDIASKKILHCKQGEDNTSVQTFLPYLIAAAIAVLLLVAIALGYCNLHRKKYQHAIVQPHVSRYTFPGSEATLRDNYEVRFKNYE